MAVYVAGKAALFDEHRNSSRVFPVPPTALPDAMRALAAYRRDHPEMYAYIEAGSPPILSQDDHIRWFGRPYERPKSTTRTTRKQRPDAAPANT